MYDNEEGHYNPEEESCTCQGEMDAPPTPPRNPFVRHMTEQELAVVNGIIRQSEGITEALTRAWKIRDSLRQVIADMICPWRVGQMIVLGEGKAPTDRRVITAILPGRTEDGEFYRVKTRVLKKGVSPGKREIGLKVTPELVIGELGMFPGVLPERMGKDGGMEV